MFTGLISEIGKVKGVSRIKGVMRLEISCEGTAEGLKLGDSVAVNGACLSVVAIKNGLAFDVVGNTFEKTNIKRLKAGSPVNLEKALRAGDMLGGHFVSGHIDGERAIKKFERTGEGWVLDIEALPEDGKYLVPRGSVAIDGVSLTIGAVEKNYFRIFLIPHTIENTALPSKKNGGYVNVEFDMTAKYAVARSSKSSITREFLADQGFI